MAVQPPRRGAGEGHTREEGRSGRAELVEDPDEVARVCEEVLGRVSAKNAQRAGLKVNVDRQPTREELKAALADRGTIRVPLG